MTNLEKSIELATRKHTGQFRKFGGGDYIVHPLRVVKRIQKFNLGEDIECATAMHDTIEDTDVTKEEILEVSNQNVLKLIIEVTNPSKQSNQNRKTRKKIDREHLAKVSDEAKIIKLCDRIDNLNDLKGCLDFDYIQLYVNESKSLLEVLLPATNKYNEVFAELRAELQACIDSLEFKKKDENQ